MSCGESPIYIFRGATWNDVYFDYLDDAGAVIPLTGLNARGTLKDSAGNVVLTLDSGGGSPNLTVTPSIGRVQPNVASNVTPFAGLTPVTSKFNLVLNLELYDGSTPAVITPFVHDFPVVLQPDQIP